MVPPPGLSISFLILLKEYYGVHLEMAMVQSIPELEG
jgi:hypothetical protein